MSRRILPVLFARSSESEYFVLNDEEFAEAERLGKVSLSEDHRIWIMQLLNANMDIAARELVSAKASAVYGALGEVERNAVALEQSLRAIEYDADIEVLRHALAKSHFRAVDIYTLRNLLDQLLNAVGPAKGLLNGLEYGGKGPDKFPGIDPFIWNLAFIYELSGGTASAAYAPMAVLPDGKVGGRNTPFVRLAAFLYAKQPEEPRLGFEALGEAISNSLERRPADWAPRGLEHLRTHKGTYP